MSVYSCAVFYMRYVFFSTNTKAPSCEGAFAAHVVATSAEGTDVNESLNPRRSDYFVKVVESVPPDGSPTTP